MLIATSHFEVQALLQEIKILFYRAVANDNTGLQFKSSHRLLREQYFHEEKRPGLAKMVITQFLNRFRTWRPNKKTGATGLTTSSSSTTIVGGGGLGGGLGSRSSSVWVSASNTRALAAAFSASAFAARILASASDWSLRVLKNLNDTFLTSCLCLMIENN